MGIHRDALGTAAIAVLATEGSRGFTHRAVDRRAGLPEGTASRYARSRAALLELASDTLYKHDVAETIKTADATSDATTSAERVAELLVGVTQALLRAPERYRARVELQLEAARAPTLRRQLRRSRAAFVTALTEVLQDEGIEPAEHHSDLLVTVVDAILHRQLVLGQSAMHSDHLHQLFCALLVRHFK